MKVALYIPELGSGGPDRVFFELAKNLSSAGVEAVVFTQKRGGYYWNLLPLHISKVCLFPEHSYARDPEFAHRQYPVAQLLSAVERVKPDVVLSTLRSLLTTTAAAATLRLKIPFVARPANHITRNSFELIQKSPLKHSLSWAAHIASLHLADAVICQSFDLYEDFKKYGIASRKLTVIGNPIELPIFESTAINFRNRKNHHNDCAPIRLVAIGRLSPQKGFDVLIEAFYILTKIIDRPVKLKIYGQGELKECLQKMILQFELSSSVELAGHSDRIHEIMSSADYLISSSRYEGFPNVILEALSCGLPVVATNCPGGTKDLISHGLTGWLCEPESAPALASAIAAALRSVPLEPSRLRGHVADKYSPKVITAAYAEVLESVVRSKRK